MIALLAMLGADYPAAIAATVIGRVSTLWFAVLIGLASISLLSFKRILPRLHSASGKGS